MSKCKWVSINDYPGDQRYDSVPGTVDTSYWGEVGRANGDTWSWTIISTDDSANTEDVDGGIAPNEDMAKAGRRGMETE